MTWVARVETADIKLPLRGCRRRRGPAAPR
jgi:hypothetical protein